MISLGAKSLWIISRTSCLWTTTLWLRGHPVIPVQDSLGLIKGNVGHSIIIISPRPGIGSCPEKVKWLPRLELVAAVLSILSVNASPSAGADIMALLL